MPTLQVEVTLYRDLKPRSRPSYILLDENNIGEPVYGKLFPGSGGEGSEHLACAMWYQGLVIPQWALIKAQFLIDGMPYSDPRPGELYTGRSDMPSSLIHFLPMAPPEHPIFGGVHTLALRTYIR